MTQLTLAEVASTDLSAAIAKLRSSQEGLTLATAHQRVLSVGPNTLPKPRPKSWISMFTAQFNNALIWLLAAAAAISWALGRQEDSLFIIFVLILNALIGTHQEYRASRILADLDSLSVPMAKVRRDGVITMINSDQVVPGDIVILEAGNHVPADCRLLISNAVTTNESTLTGESLPVTKKTDILSPSATISKATNCVFMGTTVVGGRGEGLVYATGLRTELGQIAHDLAAVKAPATPLQEQIASFSKQAIIMIGLLITAMLVLGVIAGESLTDMFLTSVSLAVAAIPEGLPVLITVVLVFGIKKMATEKALVQQQMSIQTLGQVQILLTDKTGTLTENKLTVSAVCLPQKRGYALFEKSKISPFTVGLKPVLDACLLANNATTSQHTRDTDDPVDQALLTFAGDHLPTHNALKRLPRQFEIPFDSDLKFMATFHRKSAVNTQVYIKGAARQVFALCKTVVAKDKLITILSHQANHGDKVVVTAELVIPTKQLHNVDWLIKPLLKLIKGEAILSGVVFLNDPVRPESAPTVSYARGAGVRVVMATGDNAQLATVVGHQIGLTGQAHVSLPEDKGELFALLQKSDIFAEVTPNQKLSMVQAWQSHGYTVAMTGDGVNDAPALKLADVGLAMGKRGTDIAKDAADVIMLNDNLATIITAVASGRTIFHNIQRVIAYLLASNLAEILVLFLTVITGGWLPLPLLPAQILWVNLITDSITVIPLAIEPDHSDSMHRPPRKRTDPLLSPQIINNMYLVTAIIVVLTLSVFGYYWFNTGSIDLARTTAFFVLGTVQAFNLLNARSVKRSVFALGLTTNPAVLISLVGAIALQIIILYLPVTQAYLHVVALPASTIVGLIFVSSLILWLMELKKYVIHRSA